MDKDNPGLDMKHGFIHHIRRNQVKRDEYDREVKSLSPKSKPGKSDSPKYPDQQVYRARNSDSQSKGRSEKLTDKTNTKNEQILYRLEYTDNLGGVHKTSVYRGDDPRILAERISSAAKIPNELLETLEWKIGQDIAKRNHNMC